MVYELQRHIINLRPTTTERADSTLTKPNKQRLKKYMTYESLNNKLNDFYNLPFDTQHDNQPNYNHIAPVLHPFSSRSGRDLLTLKLTWTQVYAEPVLHEQRERHLLLYAVTGNGRQPVPQKHSRSHRLHLQISQVLP